MIAFCKKPSLVNLRQKKILIFVLFISIYQVEAKSSFLGPNHARNIEIQEANGINDISKTAFLCKVWGFLKYYHPKVASGNINWDNALFLQIEKIKKIRSKEELNTTFIEWINSLGKIKEQKLQKSYSDTINCNLSLNSIFDDPLINTELKNKLIFIFEHRCKKSSYYIDRGNFVRNPIFANEIIYKDSVFPQEPLRLLGLFRYWNIINYFYPNKYLIGENWDSVLVRIIPKFSNPKDTIDYHMAMRELVSSINDGHARLITHYTNRYFGLFWVPFRFKIFENKIIITEMYDDSLAALDDIRIGDVIVKVNGQTVDQILSEKIRYVSGSNLESKLKSCYYVIFNGKNDTVQITYERSGKTLSKVIHRYYRREFNAKEKVLIPSWKILDGNIGYLDLKQISKREIKGVLKKLKTTKAIIFDIRGYPLGTMYKIARFLKEKRSPFAKFSIPLLEYPGVFKYSTPVHCGPVVKKRNYYKGKVVLLIDEKTISHAEFTCMALQTVPNSVCIGRRTAGANGNVSTIIFPGGYMTNISGLGVYYPDGKVTQRVGITPFVEVKPTMAGMVNNQDEIMERAIQYIKEKK